MRINILWGKDFGGREYYSNRWVQDGPHNLLNDTASNPK